MISIPFEKNLGRMKNSGKPKKEHNFGLRLGDEDYKFVNEVADANRVPVCSVIRFAVAELRKRANDDA
jgi:hypothetical protein